MALPVSFVQADVLVCAKGGGGLLKERMALVADLWGAGLRAEMMQQAAPSLTAQYEYAHVRHIPWLLIIHGATLSTADTVKVWPLCPLLLHCDLAAAVVLATSDPVHILQTALCYHTCVMSAVYSDGLSMGSLPPDVILRFICTHISSWVTSGDCGVQVKHLERKTGEDIPYSDVARYLQDKLHSLHASSSSSRLTASGLTSSGSLLRGLGSRLDMRTSSNAHAEGNSEDEEDPRARRRRR